MDPHAQSADEMHFKMSKKIAQLTKVIYQLNCRNEDNDTTVKSIHQKYESEIAEIMTDARDKIATLKTQLDTKKEEDKVQMVIKELTKKHEKEKNEAMRVFEDYKAKALQNETEAKRKMDDRIATMTREVTAAKEEFVATVEKLKSSHAESQASGNTELENLRAKKEKEMDDLVKEYNDRYKAMLKEQMDQQDALENKLNADWQKKYDELSQQLQGQSSDLSKHLADEKKKGLGLEKDLEAANAEIKSLQATVTNKETDIVRLQGREDHLNKQNTGLTKELEEARELQTSLRNKVSALEAEVAALSAGGSDLTEKLKSQAAANERLTSQVASLENEMAVLKNEKDKLQAAIDAANGDKSRMDAQGSALQNELSRLKETLAATDKSLLDEQAESAAQRRKVDDLNTTVANLKKQLEEETATNQEQIATLRRQMEGANQDANSSAAELAARHKAEIESIRSNLEAQQSEALEARDKKHLAAIEELEAQWKAKLEAALKEAEAAKKAEIAALGEKHREALQQIESRMAGDAAASEGAVAGVRKELDAAIKAHGEELAALKAAHAEAVAALETQLADAKAAAAARDKELDAAKGSTTDVQQQLAEAIKAAADAKLAHQKELEELKAKMSSERDAAMRSANQEGASALESERAKLRKEAADALEKERAALQKQHADAIAKLKAENEASETQLKEKIEALQRELNGVKANAESSAGSMGTEIDALKAKVDQLIADHARSEANLKKGHREEIERITAQLTAEREAAVKELTEDRDAKLAKATTDFNAKFDELSETARCNLEQMEKSYKDRLAALEKRLTDERDKALAEQQERLSGELQRTQDALGSDLERLNAARDVLEKENKTLAVKSADLDRKLNALQQRHDAECNAHATTRRGAADAEAAHKAATQAASEEAAARQAAALAAQKDRHDDAVRGLEANFDQERLEHQATVKELKRRIADIEYRYANRESRAEDVAKINELMASNKDKDEALVKAYNDMKFYKLELVNREESYNKVFGRQPSVADAAAVPAGPNSAPSGHRQTMAKDNDGHLPPGLRKKSMGSMRK